ncbi:hypothetical protein H5410_036519 [Solanum commersonii]|uniref:Uncharacterized protein n=1 Tax=Solanum commersonii TaxID=4109 RepID=A0A9J5Y5V5_SOLCO|nr:hypothetical protein H5410_036519 [Solanum commersonii]
MQRFVTKGINNEEDFTSLAPPRDGGNKHHKGRKYLKSSEEILFDPTPSKELTSHPHWTNEASDDNRSEDPFDVTPKEE